MEDAGKSLVALSRRVVGDDALAISPEDQFESRFVAMATGEAALVCGFIIEFVGVLHAATSLSADLEETCTWIDGQKRLRSSWRRRCQNASRRPSSSCSRRCQSRSPSSRLPICERWP